MAIIYLGLAGGIASVFGWRVKAVLYAAWAVGEAIAGVLGAEWGARGRGRTVGWGKTVWWARWRAMTICSVLIGHQRWRDVFHSWRPEGGKTPNVGEHSKPNGSAPLLSTTLFDRSSAAPKVRSRHWEDGGSLRCGSLWWIDLGRLEASGHREWN